MRQADTDNGCEFPHLPLALLMSHTDRTGLDNMSCRRAPEHKV